MSGFGRGKGGRGGRGRGHGSVGVLNDNSGATSSFRLNPQTQTSPETGQSSNPHQGQSIDSLSSRTVVESSHPTPETENSGAGNFGENSGTKKGRGRYKSLDVEKKTKYGSKIPIVIPDDIERGCRSRV